MARKEKNIINEALASAGQLFRHRNGIIIPDLPGIKGRKITKKKS